MNACVLCTLYRGYRDISVHGNWASIWQLFTTFQLCTVHKCVYHVPQHYHVVAAPLAAFFGSWKGKTVTPKHWLYRWESYLQKLHAGITYPMDESNWYLNVSEPILNRESMKQAPWSNVVLMHRSLIYRNTFEKKWERAAAIKSMKVTKQTELLKLSLLTKTIELCNKTQQ